MYKQSPSRSHRSKGIKTKHILQICLLLAVCFWLIYQVKHSQEKRREFDAKDTKVVDKFQKHNEILRFGRKDLPRFSEIAIGGDKQTEDDEEKEPEEEEENKHEEDEPEKEDEIIGEREEERGDEDDETDENEEEKKEAEHEHGEEQVEEDKEREDGEEEEEPFEAEENEDTRKEDHPERKENQDVGTKDHNERDASSNGQDHGSDNADNHEEREEHHKADDASSEVANHVQNIIPETENVTKVHANSIFGKENFVQENETKSSDNPDALIKTEDESREGRDGISSNLTSLAKEHPSLSNRTQTAVNTNVSLNADTVSTTVDKDPNLLGNVLGDNSKPKLATDDNVKAEASGTSNKTENAHISVKSKASGNPNKTENAHINAAESLSSSRMAVDSQKANDTTDATGAEKDSHNSDGTHDEKLEKNGAGKSDESSGIQHDPIDESDTNDEEKGFRMDLDTLPDIKIEAQDVEEAVAK